MTVETSGLKALLPMQRRNYFIGASALVSGLLLHCLVTRSLPMALIGFQALWVLLFVLMGMGVGAGWLAMGSAGVIASVIAFVALVSFVLLSGGVASPYFNVFIALPFVLAVFSPDSRMPTVLSGGASFIAILALNVLAGVEAPQVVLQLTSFSTFLGLALLGTRMYQSILDAQLSAQEERLRALEQLAESERLRGRAERERAEVERLVMVGQLAAGVAHEVNNPLAYVKANLNYLQREFRDGTWNPSHGELGDVLDETQQGVLRIQQIITDLKGFSRASSQVDEEQGRPQEALKEATRLASVRLREGGEVSLDFSPELPAVRLGQRHLVQVLLNLLLNATDAVEETEPRRRPRIKVIARRVEGAVRVVVEDNGPGIPEDVLPRLFEPFFTTKPPGKGTGLGLALCRDYVVRVGGSLHAENHPGGANFVLLLPEASVGTATSRQDGAVAPEAVAPHSVRQRYTPLEG